MFYPLMIGGLLLSAAPSFQPTKGIAANSEQRMPLILEYSWNDKLREVGEKAVMAVHRAGAQKGEWLEFEAWPAGADSIERVWVVARQRQAGKLWQWVELPTEVTDRMAKQSIFIPQVEAKTAEIFDDFLAPERGLYDKPLFGDCVFTNKSGSVIEMAWPEPDRREEARASLLKQGAVCRLMPRPPVLRGKARVFNLETDGVSVRWKNLPKMEHPRPLAQTVLSIPSLQWPTNFLFDYKRDVQIVAGEIAPHEFGRTWPLFQRKNSVQKDNQILDLVEYLEARYHAVGIPTERQEFFWRGIRQYNLLAKIPGSDPQAKPILVADHIDTAFQEDTFNQTHQRVAAPGADDNGTAVAGLLAVARTLAKSNPRHPIWLVHLTGEEFPADDLGARHLISELLRNKQQVQAVLVMDMIGYPGKDNHQSFFQINVGESPESQALGQVALQVASQAEFSQVTPLLRPRFSPRGYLHQTDALIFSDLGLPVILVNEWLNQKDNWDRPYYHQHNDNSDTLDFDYATKILKVVIKTISTLSLTPP